MRSIFLCLSFFLVASAYSYTRFQYQLKGNVRNLKVNWVFLDLFDTSSSKIKSFKSQGKTVICYFSAGTYEDWRPASYNNFSSSVIGNGLDDWPGESWLDIRSSNVLSVMKKRLDLAKSKGCHGVDPDNVDGYGNDTGFGLSKSHSVKYLRNLASEASKRGLTIGLKNSSEIASSVSSFLSWVVAEECHEWSECDAYKTFSNKGKKVFLIEYQNPKRSLCNQSDSKNMNLVFFNEDLNGKGERYCH